MIPYDLNFDPPAPILQATVSNVRNRRLHRTFPALLDTGGDITAIPNYCKQSLKLYPIKQMYIEGIHGARTPIYVYAVHFTFAELVVPRLEVILTPLEFIVMGRDLLNRFDIHLYGPQLLFEINV